MKKLTFIHGADLHLDSPLIGLKDLPSSIFQRIKESTFTAFRKLIDEAIHNQVDFVILAGDLFDGEDRSIRAQTRLRKELVRLEENQIDVFIIHGNHDHLGGKWSNLKMPENVHVFTEMVERKELIAKSGAIVNLYGFSYPKRHVIERRVLEYEKIGDADFHIGLLHGNLEGRSEHGNYAPFTLKELLDKQFDYWALGHIHKRTLLSENPPIVYPGNIQGRNRKELGGKGCYFVELTEEDSNLHFVETSDIVWRELKLDGNNLHDFQSLYQCCRKGMDSIRQDGTGNLVHLLIKNITLEDKQLESTIKQDLLEALQEEEREEESFIWPISIQFEEAIHWDPTTLSGSTDFFSELFTVINNYQDYDPTLDSLYNHTIARRFLDGLSIEDKEKILTEAENMLIEQLIRNK